MKSKFFDKDDQAAKSLFFYFNACGVVILSSHQHQEALSTWNNNALQWGHHDQNFQTYQNQEALTIHLILYLYQQGLF